MAKLKKASIKFFCMYAASSSANSGKGIHSAHQSDIPDPSETVLQEDDQFFVIRRGKGKGGRNRPNMEQMAIRRTQDAMNLKNQILAFDSAGKGTG